MNGVEKVSDLENAYTLTRLVNDAYRGSTGVGRWTSEAHLVSGPRMTAAAMMALIRDNDADLYAIYENAAPIACISATMAESDTIEFGCFAVSPPLHGSGVGKSLLQFVERTYADRYAKFQVAVVGENRALISFYEKRGYSQTSTRKRYPLDAGVGTPLISDLDLVVLHKLSK
tara:strand:- start:34118 stop:34636 length:519 start_codon:yes stop_codon:yes gene_type:complete